MSKEPSNHSFGIAIDLNSKDGCNGCTTAPLAPVFQNYGFKWGKSFNDPMHYEIMKFIDNPVSAVNEVEVAINNSGINVAGKNIFGDLFLDLSKIAGIPSLSIAKETEKKVKVAGSKGSKVFTKFQFGDLEFIPLPQALGLAGLKMKFDNDDKTAVAEEIA
ncbi:MAG TPA: M15 family metallopeptidase [Mycoplana sp.]|nr:M15 family metallopeptidase [Mycoplana sp.]